MLRLERDKHSILYTILHDKRFVVFFNHFSEDILLYNLPMDHPKRPDKRNILYKQLYPLQHTFYYKDNN